MATSFVIMNVPRLIENGVLIKLSKVREITNINSLFGEQYNLMAKIEAKDVKSLNKIITNNIRTIEGIKKIKKLKAK